MDSHEYATMYSTEERLWWYQGLRALLFDWISKLVPKQAKLLDAGCGTGKNLQLLKKSGYSVEGVDFSDQAIKFCKKRKLQVAQATITKLPYPDHYFNLIYCCDVLGMLTPADQQRALKEFYRVLKPHGYIILHCAALEQLRSHHDIVTNLAHRFSRAEIDQLLTQRWVVITLTYRMCLLLPLIAIFKISKRILRSGHPSSDQHLPPLLVNSCLLHIQLLENAMTKFVNLPIGSSLFLVAQKR